MQAGIGRWVSGRRRALVAMAGMILKRDFTFKTPKPRPSGLACGATIPPMPEALDVTCPCCQAELKVDPETGTVVWADEKKAAPKDFDDLVSRVHSQKSRLDEKFARSVQQTRNQASILDKKFEEARKRAEADPTGKPPNPFDFD